MHKNIFGLFIVLSALVWMGCTSPTTDTPTANNVTTASDKVVTLLVIPGVVAPVQGAAPVTTAIDTAQYTGTITWTGTPATFAASTVYTANIVLTAKTGWTLNGVQANGFAVAGAATTTNAVNTGAITAVFPAAHSFSLTMVNVPAGSFQRDATLANISTISNAFRMSAYEITRSQFLAIMGTDPSSTGSSSGTADPVQNVTWYHAIAFCNKLSIAEKLTPVYAVTGVNFTTLTYAAIPTSSNYNWNAATATWTNNGYRLPTEMEWMWAAMGATSDRSGGYAGTGTNIGGYAKGYAGSTETAGAQRNIGNYAWYYANSGNKTHPVGTAGTTGYPNELGLYDMSGNVFEWIWDWDGTYPSGAQTDYRGPASGSRRIMRSGGWNDYACGCTVANRSIYYPDNRYGSIGFRVVRP